MGPLHELGAASAARLIAERRLTAEALVQALLERIAARDPDIHAWVALDAESALRDARACDRSPARGPLHGIPVGVKDVIDTADFPTAYNSPIYRGHRPKADAAAVALLRRTGGIVLGKTATTEFAYQHPAATRNPHHPGHTPGGSSSGSAAAVADAMVPLALGTQTGGSIIRPASFCGIVGYKPSFGTMNRGGLKFVAESLDTIGMMARSVEDAALLAHAIAGIALPDLDTQPARAPRVGFCRTPKWEEADAYTRSQLEQAAKALERAGAQVADFDFGPELAGIYDDHTVIMEHECARALAWEYGERRELLSASIAAHIGNGWQYSRARYDAALRNAVGYRARIEEAFARHDFLLTPSAPGEAPRGLASTGSSVFNRAWTLLGLPCVTLPVFERPGGLPVGLQVVGRYLGDTAALQWAEWLRRTLG